MIKERITDSKVNKYREQITDILENRFKNQKVKVYLYGSRAKGEAYDASDIDLAVQSPDTISTELRKVKEAFFESTIPYRIDAVNLDEVDEKFKESILKEVVLFWENGM